MNGTSVQDHDGLVLLAVLGAGHQFKQTFVKADGGIYVYGSLFQIQLDARKTDFSSSITGLVNR